MEKLAFNWNVKEKPEDFIVKEVADFEFLPDGNFYLYLLIKRNLNTRDVAARYNLSYAGLKDKNALTFQYVTADKFLGETVLEKLLEGTFYGLIYLGRVRKKLKIGNLKGNKFSIKLKGNSLKKQDWFINYYDIQRISRNRERGKALLKKLNNTGSWKKLRWLENFYIDAYLSHLWNKSLMAYIRGRFPGHYLVEKNLKYFIPETDLNTLMDIFPRFWPLLGYRVEIKDYEEAVYDEVLKKEGFSLSEVVEKLSDIKIKGDYRKTFLKAEDVSIKSGRIEFFLPKGAYATMYLKHIYAG
ncbi:tRNA pseudouridine(13) synthase TruD [Persephonella sp.]